MQEFQVSRDGSFKVKLERRGEEDFIVITNGQKMVECPLDEFNEIGSVLGVSPINAEVYYARYGR